MIFWKSGPWLETRNIRLTYLQIGMYRIVVSDYSAEYEYE